MKSLPKVNESNQRPLSSSAECPTHPSSRRFPDPVSHRPFRPEVSTPNLPDCKSLQPLKDEFANATNLEEPLRKKIVEAYSTAMGHLHVLENARQKSSRYAKELQTAPQRIATPHVTFSRDIRLIISRSSGSTLGRPALYRDFHRQ